MKNEKNKVVWPDHGNLFTLKDLCGLNPGIVEITLRVRVTNAINKDKTVILVGYKNTGKGRPPMILAMAPVTKEFLDNAYASGIQPPDVSPVSTIADAITPVSIVSPVFSPSVATPA